MKLIETYMDKDYDPRFIYKIKDEYWDWVLDKSSREEDEINLCALWGYMYEEDCIEYYISCSFSKTPKKE